MKWEFVRLRRGLFFGFALVFCSLAFVTDTTAQEMIGDTLVVQASPEECDANVKGEEILAAANDLTDAACNSSAIASSDSSGLFTDGARAALKDVCTRSRNWVASAGRSTDFARTGRKANAECYVVEIDDDGIGDEDGICSPNEKFDRSDKTAIKFGCAEDDTDSIGDNDGICELLEKGQGKKVWEICLEVCDVTDLPEGDGNALLTDCSKMDHMVGALQDGADAIHQANDEIAAGIEALVAMRESTAGTDDSAAEDKCDTASTVDIDGLPFAGGARADTFTTLRRVLMAAEVLQQAGDICRDATDTTAFGFDCPAVCIPIRLGHTAASIISAAWELLDDAITGARVDNVSLCVEQLSERQGDALEKLDTIIELLNTPNGRRPDYPIKPGYESNKPW